MLMSASFQLSTVPFINLFGQLGRLKRFLWHLKRAPWRHFQQLYVGPTADDESINSRSEKSNSIHCELQTRKLKQSYS